MKFIESYLKLEAERQEVDSPFIFYLPQNLDADIKKILVPPMILQPLVENAVNTSPIIPSGAKLITHCTTFVIASEKLPNMSFVL